MINNFMMPKATSQYTNIARIVVHSKIEPDTTVLGKTLIKGNVNGYVTAYMKLVNPAPGFAEKSLRANLKAKRVSRKTRIDHAI
jgi:predicted RNase H-related nuclease YkuK (DUF458 family)